jgi:anti-anti-sigma factor
MPEAPVPSVEHLPPAVVVHVLAGELRKPEVDAICDAIDNARAAASPPSSSSPFILDMARVTFAASLALGVLVGLSKEFSSREQPLIIVNLRADVRQSIEISRLNRVLEIMPDVPTALRKLRGEA